MIEIPFWDAFKKRGQVLVQANKILDALVLSGHSPVWGGDEAIDYLHKKGMDDNTIMRMRKKYREEPVATRLSLYQKIGESII